MSMKVLSSVVIALGVLCGISTAAYADERTAVVTTAAPIYVVPDANRVPLRVAAVNTVLRVRSEEGPWLQVEFQDPQFGRRVGYVETQRVRVNNPALEPMNLSLEQAPVVAESQRLAPVPQQITAPAPAFENGRQHTREGFMFNVGLGFGSVGCEGCAQPVERRERRHDGGWAITPKVTAGFGTSGFIRAIGRHRLQLARLMVGSASTSKRRGQRRAST